MVCSDILCLYHSMSVLHAAVCCVVLQCIVVWVCRVTMSISFYFYITHLCLYYKSHVYITNHISILQIIFVYYTSYVCITNHFYITPPRRDRHRQKACHGCARHDSRMMQRTATHCNPLQHTAAHCNAPQHTATH